MKRKKHVYIVTMYRWGNRNNHSYVLGAYNNKDRAITYGVTEEGWRGGKYKCEVIKTVLNIDNQEETQETVFGEINNSTF